MVEACGLAGDDGREVPGEVQEESGQAGKVERVDEECGGGTVEF